MNIGVIIYSILLWVLLFLITIHTRLKRPSYLAAMSWIMEPKGRDKRKQIVIFRKITTVFFLSKTCFDVTNIIVSYRIFEKPLGLYNN